MNIVKKQETLPDTSMGYQLVEKQEDLDSLVLGLNGLNRIAGDLEADSMYHYKEKVCLLQLQANGRHYVIDPLAVKDMSPLAPVFANPGILKIFHGADYDIRCLYRDYTIQVQSLFDTQVAARFLGLTETGLAAVLEARLGVQLEKKFQKADWTKRPLPENMLRYAVCDAAYLIPLAEDLSAALEEKGRLAWVEEECLELSRVRPTEKGMDPLFLRFKGASGLDPRSLAVLESLLDLRRKLAKALDRPPFKVIGNIPLLELALKKPTHMGELAKCQSVSTKQARIFGEKLLSQVCIALETPDDALPSYPRQKRRKGSPQAPERITALKKWRTHKAKSLGLDPAVVLTNAQIKELASKKRRSLQDLEDVPGLRCWQQSAFGEQILAALKPVA
jgi:ribonuclease D